MSVDCLYSGQKNECPIGIHAPPKMAETENIRLQNAALFIRESSWVRERRIGIVSPNGCVLISLHDNEEGEEERRRLAAAE
jgi:hypothetical protein